MGKTEGQKVKEILRRFDVGINPLKVAPQIRGGVGRGKRKQERIKLAQSLWK